MQKKTILKYLNAQDFSKYVNLAELLNLEFEFTDDETEELSKANSNNIYKIFKVILYQFGVVEWKLKYD